MLEITVSQCIAQGHTEAGCWTRSASFYSIAKTLLCIIRLYCVVEQKVRDFEFLSFSNIFPLCISLQLPVSSSTGKGDRCVWNIPGTWRAWRIRRYKLDSRMHKLCTKYTHSLFENRHSQSLLLLCHYECKSLCIFHFPVFITPVCQVSLSAC